MIVTKAQGSGANSKAVTHIEEAREYGAQFPLLD
jgi:hypothetical protein